MSAAAIIQPTVASEALRREFAFCRYRPLTRPGSELEDEPPITVRHDAFWSYCGPLLHSPHPASPPDHRSSAMPASFQEFAEANLSGPVLPSLLPFLDFINASLVASGLGHYLVTVRATTPTHEFDRPRWHTDELFFSESADGALPGTRLGLSSRHGIKQDKLSTWWSPSSTTATTTTTTTSWKACATLLGPPTLFIPLDRQAQARDKQRSAQRAAATDHTCLSIRCVGCASAADAVRRDLAAGLAQLGVSETVPGECAFFRVGRDAGAVHSEPCMSGGDGHGRIFVNVVPGTEEELRSMSAKWGMEFPRHWWVGGQMRPHAVS